MSQLEAGNDCAVRHALEELRRVKGMADPDPSKILVFAPAECRRCGDARRCKDFSFKSTRSDKVVIPANGYEVVVDADGTGLVAQQATGNS